MRYRTMTVEEIKNIEFIHHGHDRIWRWVFTSAKNGGCFSKPVGGFWASKHITDKTSEYRSNWEEFYVSGFSHDIVKKFASCSLTFTLKDSANILLINGVEDVNKLREEFYLQEEDEFLKQFSSLMGSVCLDWEKISKKYDGVYLTEDGIDSLYHILYGWDVESICLFNLDCIAEVDKDV